MSSPKLYRPKNVFENIIFGRYKIKARDFPHILMPLMRCADALLSGMSVVAARARIHRRHEHKRCWIVDAIFCTADADVAVLKRLPHHLKDAAIELGKFIQVEVLVPLQQPHSQP